VDQGNGPVGPRAGSLFIDDQTGQPLAFLPMENNSSDSDVSLVHENQKVYKTQEGETISYNTYSDLLPRSGTTNLQRQEAQYQNRTHTRLKPSEHSAVTSLSFLNSSNRRIADSLTLKHQAQSPKLLDLG